MGVTITAYSNMTLLPEDNLTKSEHWDRGDYRAYVLTGFEQSAAGLALGRWYAPSGSTEHHEILDMSYGGYGRFRELLCSAALGKEPYRVWTAVDEHRDAPLFELINFSDNEGTIGPIAAANLLDDFTEHRDSITSYEPGIAWAGADRWVGLIGSWIAGLRLVGLFGLINFH